LGQRELGVSPSPDFPILLSKGEKIFMSAEKKKKAKNITIQGKWCKRCGICVEFCPGKVFSFQAGQVPVVAELNACTVCRMCEMRCPDYAVSVEEAS
jgi:2-oxoglutarate ferredoxin oxidoreductase subunit delta